MGGPRLILMILRDVFKDASIYTAEGMARSVYVLDPRGLFANRRLQRSSQILLTRSAIYLAYLCAPSQGAK